MVVHFKQPLLHLLRSLLLIHCCLWVNSRLSVSWRIKYLVSTVRILFLFLIIGLYQRMLQRNIIFAFAGVLLALVLNHIILLLGFCIIYDLLLRLLLILILLFLLILTGISLVHIQVLLVLMLRLASALICYLREVFLEHFLLRVVILL